MALGNCLQVSTTRVGAAQCHIHTLSSREKPILPTFTKGLKKSASSFPSFGYSKTTSRKSLFVCKAREALDKGL